MAAVAAVKQLPLTLNGFSAYEEIFDAMAVLALLAARAHRVDQGSKQAQHLATEAEKLERKLKSTGQWQIQMNAIGAKTSIDIRRHAIRLLRPEFKE